MSKCEPKDQPVTAYGREVVFDTFDRTDATPARHGESRFAFLNRSASTYFGCVRTLIEEWLSQVPVDHRPDLVGRLRGPTDSTKRRFGSCTCTRRTADRGTRSRSIHR